MNWAHIHIALNHIPVMWVILGFLLLLYAAVKKSGEIKKVSLGIFVIVAAIAIPVFLTGEAADDFVERLPGVSESIIERHEESALISLVVLAVLGVIGLVGLLLSRHSNNLPGWVVAVSLIVSTLCIGLVAKTANMGGQIRHTEIRAGDQVSGDGAPRRSIEGGFPFEVRRAFAKDEMKIYVGEFKEIFHVEDPSDAIRGLGYAVSSKLAKSLGEQKGIRGIRDREKEHDIRISGTVTLDTRKTLKTILIAVESKDKNGKTLKTDAFSHPFDDYPAFLDIDSDHISSILRSLRKK
jgi:uncharacterized membrane protein